MKSQRPEPGSAWPLLQLSPTQASCPLSWAWTSLGLSPPDGLASSRPTGRGTCQYWTRSILAARQGGFFPPGNFTLEGGILCGQTLACPQINL